MLDAEQYHTETYKIEIEFEFLSLHSPRSVRHTNPTAIQSNKQSATIGIRHHQQHRQQKRQQ